MALSELAVRKVKPKERAYKVRDSDELYLLVKENGSKPWRVNYRYLGRYGTVALARMNSKLLRPSISALRNEALQIDRAHFRAVLRPLA